jgi:phosphonate metabolism protein (transferase hexapeptide repeat family)
MLHYYDFYPKDDARIAQHRAKQLGELPLLHSNVIVHDSYVGAWTELGPNTWMSEATFDDYSYTAGDVQIIYADVGKFCSIASHVRLNPGNHPMWRVTQHHITYRRSMYGLGTDDDEVFAWRRSKRVTVGHDVWLGHGAIVMPGVQVGTGAVIGAGAVVTKDVAPYAVVVGVPAKPIRKRFDEATIAKLLQIAYWDWDRETLAARFDDLYDSATFITRYG